MKKLVLTALTLSCAASVFAQGTVVFNNRAGATSHVWGTTGSGRISGNGANDTPVGPTSYAGYSLIGTAGSPFTAAGTWASLLGAQGSGQAESALVAASGGGVTTFRTGAAAGNNVATTATFNNIAKDAASGTFEMVAWDNSSGQYSTWALASVAWQNGLIAAGKSDLFDVALIGGDVNTPPNLLNLRSFSIYMVPEPASFALAGLGAAALMIFRRRK